MTTDQEKAWDNLNLVFKNQREDLLKQLQQLDVWYEEQFVLLGIIEHHVD